MSPFKENTMLDEQYQEALIKILSALVLAIENKDEVEIESLSKAYQRLASGIPLSILS